MKKGDTPGLVDAIAIAVFIFILIIFGLIIKMSYKPYETDVAASFNMMKSRMLLRNMLEYPGEYEGEKVTIADMIIFATEEPRLSVELSDAINKSIEDFESHYKFYITSLEVYKGNKEVPIQMVPNIVLQMCDEPLFSIAELPAFGPLTDYKAAREKKVEVMLFYCYEDQ